MPAQFSIRQLLVLALCALASISASARLLSKPSLYSVGKAPIAVAIADFNNDGKADLAVCNGVENTISVLIGNGDGTFQTAVAYPAGQGTTLDALATGDFNEDGNVDILTTVSLTSGMGGQYALLAGNGDGTFASAVFTASGISPLVMAVDDLNNDGHLDVFMGGNGNSAILLGNGDGTFRQPELIQISQFGPSSGVAISDLNNDGIPDLLATDDIGNAVVTLLGNGDGTFQPGRSFPVLDCPIWVATGDFNRDGNLDAMTVDYFSNAVSVVFG